MIAPTDTSTQCDACGGLVDHRSVEIRRSGFTTIRRCIHCGHAQRCTERRITDANQRTVYFLDKLCASSSCALDDAHKAQYIRDQITRTGYVPQSTLKDLRALQRRYDTQL